MRASGILMPIASLPSKYGIGCFDKAAYKFVDTLAEAKQSYWQILPIGPTGYGDSPYQSFSTFAGNPYSIDLNELVERGYLTRRSLNKYDFGDNEAAIDYEKIYYAKFAALREAFDNSDVVNEQEFKDFCKEQKWLDDYALYMAVKNSFDGKSFAEWDDDIRTRQPEAVKEYRKKYREDYDFYCFLQYIFFDQWKRLKAYANEKGISIIGDIPIYVAYDSADCWANPELFELDEERNPIDVAGCPPDAFSATGQLWGNPLYKWDYHKKTGYKWWIERIRVCYQLYDVIRIDHFRGFDEYYAIPFGEETAVNGEWRPGPGIDLFKAIEKKLGKMRIIAEDLGFITDTVRELLEATGFPGMKVLQFAFDSREESDYLPHNYTANSVVYTGTHDNDTIQGWLKAIAKEDLKLAKNYMNLPKLDKENAHWDFICMAMRSVSDTCIIPIQDYLGLGSEARINTPSTVGSNWTWRMDKKGLDKKTIRKIALITKICGRCREAEESAQD